MTIANTETSPVLVTGVTGQFGRIVRYGQLYNPLPAPVLWHGRRQSQLDGAQVVLMDLTDGIAAWRDMIARYAPSTLLHLAGVTYTSGLDLDTMVALNADAACKVAQAADEAGVKRFFYASTAGVYGPQADDAPPLVETALLRPVSDYARSKVMAEDALCALAPKLSLSLSCLRYATTGGSDLLVRNALKARADAPLQLDQFADGTSPERSYLGPQDLADIHHRLCLAPQDTLPPILNVAPQGSVYMDQLLDALPAVFGGPIAWGYRPAGPHAVKRSVLDVTLLEQVLGTPLPRVQAPALAHQIKAFLDAKPLS